MKKVDCVLLFSVLLMITTVSQAAPCRAVSAAQIGSQRGYEQAKKAADAWAMRETQATNTLQQCLGGISTSITVPTFPNLTDLLNGLKNKVCAAARDKIAGYIPNNINPWGELKVADTPLPSKTLSASQPIIPTPDRGSPFTLN